MREAIRDLSARYGVDLKALVRRIVHELGGYRRIVARSAGHHRRAYRQSSDAEEDQRPGGALGNGNEPRRDRIRRSASAPNISPIRSAIRPRQARANSRLAAELGFKTAVTTQPGVLFREHRHHLTALPRISLNGEYQQLRYLRGADVGYRDGDVERVQAAEGGVATRVIFDGCAGQKASKTPSSTAMPAHDGAEGIDLAFFRLPSSGSAAWRGRSSPSRPPHRKSRPRSHSGWKTRIARKPSPAAPRPSPAAATGRRRSAFGYGWTCGRNDCDLDGCEPYCDPCSAAYMFRAKSARRYGKR